MTLSDILHLPAVWSRLIGRRPITTDSGLARSARKLLPQMAERERQMDALERVGLQAHAVENIYPPPLDPKSKKRT